VTEADREEALLMLTGSGLKETAKYSAYFLKD
jgi:hypothetical protein